MDIENKPAPQSPHVCHTVTIHKDWLVTLTAVMSICVLGVAAIIILEIVNPAKDNSQLIATIIGFLTPTMVALLATVKSVQNSTAITALHAKSDKSNAALAELDNAVACTLIQLKPMDQSIASARMAERVLAEAGKPLDLTKPPEKLLAEHLTAPVSTDDIVKADTKTQDTKDTRH